MRNTNIAEMISNSAMFSITENDFIEFELLFPDAKITFFGNVFNKPRNNQSDPILKKLAIHAFEPLNTAKS